MVLNQMEVRQADGLYYIFTQQAEMKAVIQLPHDGQTMADFDTMRIITKALALRWGIVRSGKKR